MTDALYSFDTSAILNGRRDLFRPTVFHTLWAQIEDAIAAGQIRSVDEVQRELARRDDDAKQWADAQGDLFVPLDLPIQQSAAQILHPAPPACQPGRQAQRRRPVRHRAGDGQQRHRGDRGDARGT